MKKALLVFCVLGLFQQLQIVSAQNLNITFAAQVPYPGQTLANICGYAANGAEYALCGAENGMSIVDVTVPTSPVVITQVPFNNQFPGNALWKEIKVYKNYAYVTSEAGSGLQIIDLANLPSTSLTSHYYTGDGAIAGQLSKIHALHIDTTKKFIYLYGTDVAGSGGGAIILDINTDPYNPTYAGKFVNPASNYIHDGYVDNDTLYAGHIYAGTFSVVDVTNKSNPVLLASQQTPTAFTHNTWLTNDRKTLLTTDENSNSYLTAYDVSDLNNITETDKIRATPGSGSIVHNTHILNNWAVTSWYRDGITIVDVTRPGNLVQVGNYDTYSGTGNGFDGAWGVYPFLPSGTLVVSNIDEGLFVLSPNYVRACYLEGTVIDSVCGLPLSDVTVTISGLNITDSSNASGWFATGTAIPGTYNVTFSKPGYTSQTIPNVTFTPGAVNNFNISLSSPNSVVLSGSVNDGVSSAGLPSVQVVMVGSNTYNFSTDASGNFSSCNLVSDTYSVTTAAWGYETVCESLVTINSSNSNISLPLDKMYYDDFNFDLGWTVVTGAPTGAWERGVPNGTFFGTSIPSNPGVDVTGDCGSMAYVTGNDGGTSSQDDIDNGATTLTSPVFDLSTYSDAWIHYDRWFFNGGGSGTPNDSMKISLSNGTQTVVIETITATTANNSSWVHSAKKVSQFLTPTNNMQLIVRAADTNPGHLVEGAFDKFFVVDSLSIGMQEQSMLSASLQAFPNPFSGEIQVRWAIPAKEVQKANLVLVDLSGRVIRELPLNAASGLIVLKEDLAEGVYFLRIREEGQSTRALKIIKVK
jgi:choice-of-anchor B domain-containing protein